MYKRKDVQILSHPSLPAFNTLKGKQLSAGNISDSYYH